MAGDSTGWNIQKMNLEHLVVLENVLLLLVLFGIPGSGVQDLLLALCSWVTLDGAQKTMSTSNNAELIVHSTMQYQGSNFN